MRAADRRVKGPANDPRRIMRGSLIRVEPAEIYCVAMKGRGDDRSRRHHGLAGARGNTAKVIISVRTADQIPSVALEATTAGIKESMAGGHLRLRRDEGLQSNQKNVLSMIVADLRHVIVRGYRVADVHFPCLAEKIVEIKIGGLAAVMGIDPDNSPRCALDSG